jgi:hypothetical protein
MAHDFLNFCSDIKRLRDLGALAVLASVACRVFLLEDSIHNHRAAAERGEDSRRKAPRAMVLLHDSPLASA